MILATITEKTVFEIIERFGVSKGIALAFFVFILAALRKIPANTLTQHVSNIIAEKEKRANIETRNLAGKLPDRAVWAIIHGQYKFVYSSITDEINRIFDINNRADGRRQKAIELELRTAARLAINEVIRNTEGLTNANSIAVNYHLVKFRHNELTKSEFWEPIVKPILKEPDPKIARQASLSVLKSTINDLIEHAYDELRNTYTDTPAATNSKTKRKAD